MVHGGGGGLRLRGHQEAAEVVEKRPKYYGLNCWKWWYHTEWSSIVDTYNFNENEEENSGEDAKTSKQSSVPAKEAKTKTPKPDVETPKPKSKILIPEAETKAPKEELRGGIQVVDLKKGSGPECEPGNKVDMFYEGVTYWIMTDYWSLFSSLYRYREA